MENENNENEGIKENFLLTDRNKYNKQLSSGIQGKLPSQWYCSGLPVFLLCYSIEREVSGEGYWI